MKVERIEMAPRPFLGLHEVVPASELAEFFGRAFGTVASELARHGSAPTGPAVALYGAMSNDKVDVTAGFPVEPATAAPEGLVRAVLPGGTAIQTTHVGPYDGLQETYAELSGWMADHGLTPAAMMWEQYLVGPGGESDPAKWRTRIVYPTA